MVQLRYAIVVLAGILSGLCIAVRADAATYYVSPAGSDFNDGTLQQPFQTIKRGLRPLQPGDTLYIRGGVYNGRIFEVDFGASGIAWTAGNFITVAAYPGEIVTIGFGTGGNIVRFQDGSVHHVLISGLTLDGIYAGGGYSAAVVHFGDTSQNLHFNQLEIKDGEGNGLYGGGDSHELRDLNVHGNGREGITTGVYLRANGAYLATITNSLIIGGQYWDNQTNGIRIGSSAWDRNASNNVIDGVACFNNGYGVGLGGLSVTINTGAGIVLADVDNTVRNSLLFHNTEGLTFYGLSGKVAPGLKAYNNTIFNNVVGVELFPLASGAELRNNIIYANSRDVTDNGTGTATSGNLSGDPKFVNASVNDFRLQPGSAAIDAGAALSGVVEDFNGASRSTGGATDLGAYEFGAISDRLRSVTGPSIIP